MMKKKKEEIVKVKTKLYEFLPSEDINTIDIIELSKKVRIGVGENLYESLSADLRKHFKEVA